MRHFLYKTPYSESSDAQQARIYRRVIRKIPRKVLPDAQRDVLMALFNVHWKYKNQRGTIEASCAHIAKLAKCSLRTVKTAMSRFRDEGVIGVHKYGKGGRKPTVYRFNILALLEAYDPSHVTVKVDADLVHYTDVSQDRKARENRAGSAHEYIYNTYSGFLPCGEAHSQPVDEDWWTALLQSHDQSQEKTYPWETVSRVIPFWQGRVAA